MERKAFENLMSILDGEKSSCEPHHIGYTYHPAIYTPSVSPADGTEERQGFEGVSNPKES